MFIPLYRETHFTLKVDNCGLGRFPTPPILGGFSGGSEVKASACNAGDLGSIPGSGRSPGEGNGNHSSILAWRISRMEEPEGLESTGS